MNKRALSFILAVSTLPIHAEFAISEKDGTLRITDKGKLITAFRTDYRVPYLYPLTAPGGANVSRHWPMETDAPEEEKDHPHHRGLWLSHGDVNGYDFWAGFDKKDASIKLKSIVDAKAEGGAAHFTADLVWTAEGKELLREQRRHSISRPTPETHRIDIESNLTAIGGDVVFGDTKEGTFAVRVDRTLRVKGDQAKAVMTNSNGELDLEVWGKRAKWVAASGPDETGKPVVVAIIEKETSFRHPTHWHARDYGLLAANPFGIHDFEKTKDKTAGSHTLKKGDTLTLSYTVILHQGSLESADLDKFR